MYLHTFQNFSGYHRGFLQRISRDQPEYVKLAQIGFLLGQELLKCIDLQPIRKNETNWDILRSHTLPNNNVASVQFDGMHYTYTVS